MNVYLWNFTKKKKSTKIPATTPTPVDVKLKDMVDIEHPRFELTKATLGNNNYMKTTFYDGKERYYFLTDISEDTSGHIIASFEEDYLATWGCGQENGESAFISRCGSVANERYFGQKRLKDPYREFTGKVNITKKYLLKRYMGLTSHDMLQNRIFLIGLHCGENGLFTKYETDKDFIYVVDDTKYNNDLKLDFYSNIATGLSGGYSIYKPINAFAVRGNMAYYMVYGSELVTFANKLLELAIKFGITTSKWEAFLESVQMDIIATPFTTQYDSDIHLVVGCDLEGSSPVRVYQRRVVIDIKNGVSLNPAFSDAWFDLNVLARVPNTDTDNPTWTDAQYKTYLVNKNGTDRDLCYSEFTIPMDSSEIINSGRDGTSFREYTATSPYSSYTLRVPMWGTLEIPMEKVHDAVPTDDDYNNYVNPSYEKRLKLKWCMDWVGGNAFIGIYNTDDTFVCGDIKQMCYRMPIQVNYDDTGMAQSIFKLTTAGLALISPIAGLANATAVQYSAPTPQLMEPPVGASQDVITRYQKTNDALMKPYNKAQESVDNELSKVVNYASNIPTALSGFLNSNTINSGALATQSDLDSEVEDNIYILISRAELVDIFYDTFGVPVEKVITFYDAGQPSKAGFWVYKNYNPKRYGTLHERDMLKAICEGGFWVE